MHEALAKMDEESKKLTQINQTTRKITSQHERQKEKAEINSKELAEEERKISQKKEFKNKMIMFGCLFIGAIIFVGSLSRSGRTTLIENIIYVVLIAGVVASKKGRF